MKRLQHGVAAVEFALIAMILFLLLIGIMEIARVLFIWNSANEATRYGARVAVVCAKDDAVAHKAIVVARMQTFLPNLTTGNVTLEYLPSSTAVERVRVSLKNLSVQTVIPIFQFLFPVPATSTTLPSESFYGTAATSQLCKLVP
jgi:Flp pilus assembly protein TadG